jgi:hypothetical protein
MGLDTKTDRLTDRRSQCDSDSDSDSDYTVGVVLFCTVGGSHNGIKYDSYLESNFLSFKATNVGVSETAHT